MRGSRVKEQAWQGGGDGRCQGAVSSTVLPEEVVAGQIHIVKCQLFWQITQ